MCHRQLSKAISQSPEYVENFCNDRSDVFHFACRKWMNKL